MVIKARHRPTTSFRDQEKNNLRARTSFCSGVEDKSSLSRHPSAHGCHKPLQQVDYPPFHVCVLKH